MPEFTKALKAWKTSEFNTALKTAVVCLPPGALPLATGTTQGGLVDDQNISATILRSNETEHAIQAHVGIFFTELVPSCNCGENPDEINAYCEIEVVLNKDTADVRFLLTGN